MSKINKKIQLGSKGFFGEQTKDLYLDVNLNNVFNEIRPERYDNDFDIQKQFQNERNASRDFILYGFINSISDFDYSKKISAQTLYENYIKSTPTKSNTTNYYNQLSIINDSDIKFLELWKSPGVVVSNPVIKTYVPKQTIVLQNGEILTYVQDIPTSPTTYKNGNAFDIFTRKYYVELSGYSSPVEDVVYLFVNGSGLTPSDASFKTQDQLFGQQLVFRDNDGNPIPYGTNNQQINTDGSLLEINNDYPFFYNKHWINKTISIDRSFVPVATFLTDTLTVSRNNIITIPIQLDRELQEDTASILLSALDITTQTGDYIVPTIVNFVKGQASTSFDIQISGNSIIELTEQFTIEMSGFVNISPGAITSILVTISPTDIPNSATYNFQNLYKNLTSFNVYPLMGGTRTSNNYNNYSYLRDGFFVSGNKDPNSFYTNNSFSLAITNNGVDTIFPLDNGLSYNEFIFSAGTTYNINVFQTYGDLSLSSLTIHSLGTRINVNSGSSEFLAVDINGEIFDGIKTNSDLYNLITGSTGATFSARTYTVELTQIFDLSDVLVDEYVSFFSVAPGIPIVLRNLNTNIGSPEFEIMDETSNPDDFTDFVPYGQNPITLKLKANSSDGLYCNYGFGITQNYYKNVSVLPQILSASTASTSYYLTSSFRNTKIPYYSGGCIADFSNDSAYTVNKISVNGTLFVYDSIYNLTTLSTAQFESNPLSAITCTMNNGISGFTF